MNRERVDRFCERGILAAVLATLVYTPLAFGGRPQIATGLRIDFLVVNPFLVPQLLIVAVILFWAVRLCLSSRPQILWPPICWFIAAFTLYALLRYFAADIEYVARQEVIRILVYFFLFFAVLNNLYRQESIQLIVFTLISLGIVLSAYALFQFLTDSNKVWHIYKPYMYRGTGTYISPNHLGGFLEMLLPLSLSYTLLSRLKTVHKVFLGYAVLVIVAGIAVTVSRGSWFSTAGALGVFFGILFLYERYRLPSFIFLFVMLVALGFFFPKTFAFQVRIKQLFAHGRLNDDLRFDLWQPAYLLFREDPLWGAGPGHYDFRFRKYRPKVVQLQPDRAHNDFLNTFVDWGVVGAGLIGAAWLMLYVGVVRMWRVVRVSPTDFDTRQSNKFALVIGGSLGILAVSAHSLVDFNMHIPANAMVAVTLVAFVSSHLRFATDNYWITLKNPARIATVLVLLAGAAFIATQAVRHGREKYWLAKAELASDYSPAKVRLLENAFAIEPKNFETAFGIGEAYRVQSKEGGEDYQQLAAKAMQWFERTMKLNPWDGYGFLQYGMCLAWVNRTNEAAVYLEKAEALDPNGYFTVATIGLHYIEVRNYPAARVWLERSKRLWTDNKIAENYLPIVNRRLLEQATNETPFKVESPIKVESSPPQ